MNFSRMEKVINKQIVYKRFNMEGKKPVRVIVMSDTHDLHFRVDVLNLPKADIFIHAGDFTKFSTTPELLRFRQFLNLLPYKHKVVIAGNHEFGLDKIAYQGLSKRKHGNIPAVDTEKQIQELKKICTYLEHESVEIEGLKIFGSPYSLEFHDWGFMHTAEDADKLWGAIPENTDILVTHGPPHGILDKNMNKFETGCISLRKHAFRVKPKLHVFGHIHEAYGMQQHQGIIFANASSTNLFYKLVNPPMVFDIEPK